MADPIEFWFEFSSPYGYLGAMQIDALAEKHGRSVDWRPFLLGATFKVTGLRPLFQVPMKSDYMAHDLKRAARRYGFPIETPPEVPFLSVAASRAVCWLRDRDVQAANALAKALYVRSFGEGRSIAMPGEVVEVAVEQGLDADEVAAALKDPAVKQRLREAVEEALARGVFGSPFVIVDGEAFWGHDRLPEVDQWLTTGGW